MKTLDGGRIGVGAQGLGIAEGAFEIAKEYLKTREQFGKPLYRNQINILHLKWQNLRWKLKLLN